MNINDYDMIPMDTSKQTRVEYFPENQDLPQRYPEQSTVNIKGRKDFKGVIDRLENGRIVVKMFGETYSVPPSDFDSIFSVHSPRSTNNWYGKLKQKE